MSDEQGVGDAVATVADDSGGDGAPITPEVVNRQTGEIVPLGDTTLASQIDTTPAALAAWFDEMESTPDAGSEQVQVDIARRILEAETVEDLWKATEVVTADALLYQAIEVQVVRWATSRHEAGLPKFAVIEGTKVADGGAFVMTCGATNVVLTLYKLQKMNALPCRVMLEKKPTGTEGRQLITIKPVA